MAQHQDGMYKRCRGGATTSWRGKGGRLRDGLPLKKRLSDSSVATTGHEDAGFFRRPGSLMLGPSNGKSIPAAPGEGAAAGMYWIPRDNRRGGSPPVDDGTGGSTRSNNSTHGHHNNQGRPPPNNYHQMRPRLGGQHGGRRHAEGNNNMYYRNFSVEMPRRPHLKRKNEGTAGSPTDQSSFSSAETSQDRKQGSPMGSTDPQNDAGRRRDASKEFLTRDARGASVNYWGPLALTSSPAPPAVPAPPRPPPTPITSVVPTMLPAAGVSTMGQHILYHPSLGLLAPQQSPAWTTASYPASPHGGSGMLQRLSTPSMNVVAGCGGLSPSLSNGATMGESLRAVCDDESTCLETAPDSSILPTPGLPPPIPAPPHHQQPLVDFGVALPTLPGEVPSNPKHHQDSDGLIHVHSWPPYCDFCDPRKFPVDAGPRRLDRFRTPWLFALGQFHRQQRRVPIDLAARFRAARDDIESMDVHGQSYGD